MNTVKLESPNFLEKFESAPNVNKAYWEKVLKLVCEKTKTNIEIFGDKYPAPASTKLRYELVENDRWTSSFWPGMLWQAWLAADDEKFLKSAKSHLESFKYRIDNKVSTATHDLGFLYSLTCVADYRFTGDLAAAKVAVDAADQLLIRFSEISGIIQAWGDLEQSHERGRIIIDCFLNLPLLFWASEYTGNNKYSIAATSHLTIAQQYLIREDASTFHTYHFDPETGVPLKGTTHQGYSDTSCWARGQAWGIYGLMLSYKYIADPALLDMVRRLAHYFLNRLPEDHVCYWDLIFTDGIEERDSSAAATAAAGLLDFAIALPASDSLRRIYENAALHIMKSLSDKYLADPTESDGILLHGTCHKPHNYGVDECTIFGDYYFIETLNKIVSKPTIIW